MLHPPPRLHSRRAVAVALGLPAALLVLLLLLRGGPATWELWHIKAASPPFLDTRVFTSAAESWRQGLDPLVSNPADSSHRPLNYPRVWHLLFPLGLGPQHANLFGATLLGLFAAGLASFVLRHREMSPWWFAAAVFSPAILLGVERGNIDLAVFALVAFALGALARERRAPATLALVAAGVLKLFPFAALVALLEPRPSRSLRWLGPALAAAALYLLFTYDDLALIRAATPAATWYAYGWKVLPDLVASHQPARLPLVQAAATAVLAAAALAALAGWLRGRPAADRCDDGTADALPAFRVGAACYLGTFLLGGNFNYRLAFLLFALPQLVRWCRAPGRRPLAILSLACLYVGLWIARFEARDQSLDTTLDWGILIAGQVANASLFVALAWLFARTLPDGLRPDWPAWRRAFATLQPVDFAVALPIPLSLAWAWHANGSAALRPLDFEETLLAAAAAGRQPPLALTDGADLFALGPLPVAWLQALLPCAAGPLAAARTLALGLFGVFLLLGYIALRQRHRSSIALLALLPAIAAGAVLAAWGLLDHWRTSTLVAGLLASTLCLATIARHAATTASRIAAVLAAGALLALLPLVSVPGAFLFLPAGAIGLWILRRESGLRFAALLGGGFSLLAGLAWLHGSGQWTLAASYYWSGLFRPPPWSGALWLHALAALAVAAAFLGGTIAAARFAARARTGGRFLLLAIAAALLVIAFTLPPRVRTAGVLERIARRMSDDAGGRWGDRLVVWGESPALHVLAERPPAVAWIVPRRAADPHDAVARARYLEHLRAAMPVYFADTTGHDTDPAFPAHESFPALAAFIRENYTLLADEEGVRLYQLSRLARARNVLRPGIVPLRIETMTRTDAKVPPQYLREYENSTRIFTHAAAHYVHPVPAGAVRLRGVFGVLPGAYEKPDAHTDGAIFIVEAVTADGQHRRLLEQPLDPFAYAADRGDHAFDVSLAGLPDLREIHLIVDPRGSDAFDWMYWADLNFATESVSP